MTREARSGTGAYDITYTFDAVGNRTTKQSGGTTTTYAYNAGDALTLEDAAGTLTTYTWDAAGNGTLVNAAGTLTTFTWDEGNRLSTLTAGGATTTFSYSATGLRRKRQDGSGTTDFVWDGERLLMELASGSTVAHYSGAGGSPAAYGPMLSQRRSGASRFYHPSLLGTVEALTDTSGDTTDSYVLDAFGVSHALSGSTTNPHVSIGSLGYYTDPLGPLYVRARWLRPSTGSWLSADPVLSEPRYQYVGGRATRQVDPTGQITQAEYDRRRRACYDLFQRAARNAADGLSDCLALAPGTPILRERHIIHCNELYQNEMDQIYWLLKRCLAAIPPVTSVRKAALAVAQAYVEEGIAETGSNTGPVIDDMQECVFGNSGHPWCACFAYRCYTEGGLDLPVNPVTPPPGVKPPDFTVGYVGTWVAWAKDQEYLHTPGEPGFGQNGGYTPCPGDLFIIGGDAHIGLVESCAGDTITTIEGNWHDRVSRDTRPVTGPTHYIHVP